MSKKYKNTCKYLNYVEHLLILAWTITGCVFCSFSAITRSAVGIKICAITSEMKKYKSII